MIRRFRNVVRGVLQSYGPARVKRALWNSEFKGGRWNCLESTPGDCIYTYIEKYAQSGSILDLGCGSGSTGNELSYDSYGKYTGVDISDAAVQKSIVRSQQNGRQVKNNYCQFDVFRYVPSQRYDVILFRDSLYYVPRGNVKSMLDRYSHYLTKRGVFVVRMANGNEKYRAFVETIELNYRVVEKAFVEEQDALVLVFSGAPQPARKA